MSLVGGRKFHFSFGAGAELSAKQKQVRWPSPGDEIEPNEIVKLEPRHVRIQSVCWLHAGASEPGLCAALVSTVWPSG